MTKVKVRKYAISGGRQSLYLDFYPPITHPETGKPTRREFLKLHLMDRPKNEFEKESNREAKALAEGIRAKRQLEIQEGKFGFLLTSKRNANFVEYFQDLADKRTGSNSDNWYSALNYLEDFTSGQLRFADLNEQVCYDFREFLLRLPASEAIKKPSLKIRPTVTLISLKQP